MPGSVVLKIASTSTIHKAPEKSPDGGNIFRPLDYSRALTDRFFYTLFDDYNDDAPFQHPTEARSRYKKVTKLECKREAGGGRGERGKGTLWIIVPLCVFCEDENFKQTRKMDGILK